MRSAGGGSAARSGAGSPRLTGEMLVLVGAAGQSTSLRLELIHGDSGQGGAGVVLRILVVNLVDGNGGMDGRGLDRLLLDDGLDVLDAISNMSTGLYIPRTS